MLDPPIHLLYLDSLRIGTIANCVLVPVGILVACAVLRLRDPVFTTIAPVASLLICVLMRMAICSNQVH